jgi:hypothetical protein
VILDIRDADAARDGAAKLAVAMTNSLLDHMSALVRVSAEFD